MVQCRSGNRKQIKTIKKIVVKRFWMFTKRKVKNSGLLKTGQTENEENSPTCGLMRKIYDDDEMLRYYLKQRNINKRENDQKHTRTHTQEKSWQYA